MDIINDELQFTKFGFSDVEPERFYHSQWTKNRLVFLVYRLGIFAYSFAWTVTDFFYLYSLELTNYWIVLTSWVAVTGCFYFFVALVVVSYGYSIRNTDTNQQELQWFHIIVWILFITTLSGTLTTDLSYWIFLSWAQHSYVVRSPFNIYEHAINYVLFLIDLFVNDIPMRFFHFVYPVAFGILYLLLSLGLWIYELYKGVKDWITNPTNYALAGIISTFVVMPIVHALWHFNLYRLRLWTAQKCLSYKNKNNCSETDKEDGNE